MGFDITVVESKNNPRLVNYKGKMGFGSCEWDIPTHSRGCGSKDLENDVKDFAQEFSINDQDYGPYYIQGSDLLEFSYYINCRVWYGTHLHDMVDMYFFNMYKWALIMMAELAYEKGCALEFSW